MEKLPLLRRLQTAPILVNYLTVLSASQAKRLKSGLPYTGERRRCPVFGKQDGRTTVPLQFEPYGSALSAVVFRSLQSPANRRWSQNGGPNFCHRLCQRAAGVIEIRGKEALVSSASPAEIGTYSLSRRQKSHWPNILVGELPRPGNARRDAGVNVPLTPFKARKTRPTLFTVANPDRVSRPPQLKRRAEKKYFPARLPYTREALSHTTLAIANTSCLDLGKVCEIAEVELHGQTSAILWKPPTRLDYRISKPGTNHLTVRVTNFGLNRIIGEHSCAMPTRPPTKYSPQCFTANTPLKCPPGLLGPVRLLTIRRTAHPSSRTGASVSRRFPTFPDSVPQHRPRSGLIGRRLFCCLFCHQT